MQIFFFQKLQFLTFEKGTKIAFFRFFVFFNYIIITIILEHIFQLKMHKQTCPQSWLLYCLQLLICPFPCILCSRVKTFPRKIPFLICRETGLPCCFLGSPPPYFIVCTFWFGGLLTLPTCTFPLFFLSWKKSKEFPKPDPRSYAIERVWILKEEKLIFSCCVYFCF